MWLGNLAVDCECENAVTLKPAFDNAAVIGAPIFPDAFAAKLAESLKIKTALSTYSEDCDLTNLVFHFGYVCCEVRACVSVGDKIRELRLGSSFAPFLCITIPKYLPT